MMMLMIIFHPPFYYFEMIIYLLIDYGSVFWADSYYLPTVDMLWLAANRTLKTFALFDAKCSSSLFVTSVRDVRLV